MAKKKLEEPEKWITVNGQHLPVYAGGRIGTPGQEEPKKDTTSKSLEGKRNSALEKISKMKDLNEWDRNDLEDLYKDNGGAWIHSDAMERAIEAPLSGKKTSTEKSLRRNFDNMMRAWEDTAYTTESKEAKAFLEKEMKDYRDRFEANMKQWSGIANNGTKTTSKNAMDSDGQEESKKQVEIKSYKAGMTKEERRAFLDNAPVGTKITGLMNKQGTHEYTVEKVESYSTVYGGIGAGTKHKETYWAVDGTKNPYIARNLREAEEGTSKYYSFKSNQPTTTTSRNAKYDTSRVSYVQKSVASLKTMYKNAIPEDKKRIAAEMNARGYYYRDGKWVSHK